MNKKTIVTVLLCALILLFLGGGIVLLTTGWERQNVLLTKTVDTQEALKNLDASAAQEQEAVLQTREEQQETLKQQLSDAEQALAELDREISSLEQEKQEILEAEESQYFLTIIESFMKGMELVDGYLNEAQ